MVKSVKEDICNVAHFTSHCYINSPIFSRPGLKPGAALQTPLSLIQSLSQPFPPTALRRRHAQTRDSSSNYKIDYDIVIQTFLNPEGHLNRISGSKVTAILLNGWILPIGGASAVEGLRSTWLPRLV